MRYPAIVSQLLAAVLSSGCGAILSGTHQKVHLDITPPGAEVVFYHTDGSLVSESGVSPGVLKVHRPRWREPYLVRVSKAGYCPRYFFTTIGISAGGWGTVLLFNGIIPVTIDASTGGMYKIKPDRKRPATILPLSSCPTTSWCGSKTIGERIRSPSWFPCWPARASEEGVPRHRDRRERTLGPRRLRREPQQQITGSRKLGATTPKLTAVYRQGSLRYG